ncbi:MAG: chromosomal replication initiator protein DnaA [Oscillospiraceae bacterium]|jgi:chromosomal replication initiator protein|nr:chromosomal replication initiator protein DnaA [Oscillospiraceae bacterium]
MTNLNDIFAKVCEYCKGQISSVGYNLWIDVIDPVSMDHDIVNLKVKSSFQKKIILDKYSTLLHSAFEAVLGFPVKIEIACSDDHLQNKRASRRNSFGGPFLQVDTEKQQEPVISNYEYCFASFIVGPSNKFAHAASLAVAANPSGAYNPLFIYGGSGLGKTHLLCAICHEMLENNPKFNVLYVKGEEFTNELIEAIGRDSTKGFHDKYRKSDVLLVDDIQFIAGKERTQEEFFHTFNELYQAGRQIVLTSDRPPKEIRTLEDRLRTRFEWGLIADIQPPDFETRVAIIRRKAEILEIKIPDDVAEYIANRIKDNIRQLEGAVKKLKAYKALAGTIPSVAIAQTITKDILTEEQPLELTFEKIMSEVSRTFGTSVSDLKSQKRSSQVSRARQIAIYIARAVLEMPTSAIGAYFGGRDHSTIIYSLSKIERTLNQDIKLKEIVDDIIKNIKK